jgi:hypothetical protein
VQEAVQTVPVETVHEIEQADYWTSSSPHRPIPLLDEPKNAVKPLFIGVWWKSGEAGRDAMCDQPHEGHSKPQVPRSSLLYTGVKRTIAISIGNRQD